MWSCRGCWRQRDKNGHISGSRSRSRSGSKSETASASVTVSETILDYRLSLYVQALMWSIRSSRAGFDCFDKSIMALTSRVEAYATVKKCFLSFVVLRPDPSAKFNVILEVALFT